MSGGGGGFCPVTVIHVYMFTTLSAVVHGVFLSGRIGGPYALDVAGNNAHSPTRCSPIGPYGLWQTVGGE